MRRVGLWTPGHPDASSWIEGREVEEAKAPDAKLLSGVLRRRASPLTRMAVEALAQAMVGAEVDASEISSVWGSVSGESETSVALLAMMNAAEGKLSPTRFHNSVFNTAAGYASIALKNRAPSTTLCGGSELVATCLLEVGCRLESGEKEVVLVLLDEPQPEPFGPASGLAPLTLALRLAGDARGAIAALCELRIEACDPISTPARFDGLYIAGALPMLERMLRGQAGRVGLETGVAAGAPAWSVDVVPGDA